MKAPVQKLLPTLIAMTNLARENLASTYLRSDKVRELLVKAAREGQYELRIKLPDTADVKETDGARDFDRWAKQQGLVVTWENRTVDLPDGRRKTIMEPEISWAPCNSG